jgi:electron transfer flavoprotein alpha subunit
MAPLLVLVTSSGGTPDEVSLQGLALARRIVPDGPVHALVIGDAAAATGLGAWGASQAHLASHPTLGLGTPDAAGRVVADLASRLGASIVIGPGTETGHTIVARAAARAGLPFAANCLAVTPGDPITVTRSRWGGSLLEEAAIHGGGLMLTVAAHAVPAAETGGSAQVETFEPQLDDADLAVRVVARIPAATGGVSLSDARIVVSGGRGVGSAEGFKPVEELAGLLGAAVGCSRAVTISGWRSHTDQVGQTGTKIAPNLYIAAGISGATQHLAGTKGAKRILAINKDAEAPIMAAADYAVVGDLHQVLPAISAEIRRARGG